MNQAQKEILEEMNVKAYEDVVNGRKPQHPELESYMTLYNFFKTMSPDLIME